VTYVFKHALVRDTAYESLLKSRRRELHGSIARALGTHFPAIVESQPELLAHHYTESSAVADALPHWRRAGQLALERSAHAEAVNHLERGLALLGTLPAGRDRTAMELAFRMPLGIGLIASTGYASDAVADNLTRARACCHELGSVPELVLFGLWFFNLVRADREATLDLATQLLTLAEQTRDTTQLLLANSAMASTMHFHGNPLVSRQHATRALALHDPERHRSLILGTGLDPAVSSHFYNAANLWQLGYPDQALAQVGEALARARTAVHALALAGTLSFGATIRLWRGELDDAEALAEELVAVSREQGLPVWLGFALAERGQAMVQRGEASAGLQQIEEGIAIYRATGALLNVQGLLHSRAEACLALGNVVEGMNAVEEAIALAERGIDRVFEPDVRRLRAELRLLAGDAAGAERSFLEAIAVARERESRGWELRAVNGLARLWGRNGKRHVARDMLGSLYASFTEGFDTADLRQARALLAELT
jgi:predicted ATPase